MGRFSQQFSRQQPPSSPQRNIDIAVGSQDQTIITTTFNDRNITFSGNLAGYNYDSILRDKQKNIIELFRLSDYFVDSDPIFRGIIKEVYTPFSIADNFRLIGSNERVKQKYLDYYKRIHLQDKMSSIFLQFYKYGNVYVYQMDDGNIITLPVHLVRIANVMVQGEPVIEFNCKSVRDDIIKQGNKALKDFLEDEDLDVRLKGFPKEVSDGIKAGKDYVQLNPANTFVLQDLKEDWVRYAVPMVASCQKAFAKKELISTYEDSLINLGARSFVHVKYGDPKHEVLPDVGALNQVNSLFRKAMTGTALAVTNNFCSAEVIQPKTDDVFEYDKYKGVNADILSAGGISGIIVSGRAEDGSTFASAQVSMQTAAMRIKQAKDSFCEMMDKINSRLNGSSPSMPHSAPDQIPRFTFPPVDLSGSKAFQEACFKLWKDGLVSNQTLLQTYGYDMGQEVERKRDEQKKGYDITLMPTESKNEDNSTVTNNNDEDKKSVGRPTMEDDERTSDPANAITGKQPKPSNPEGSMDS